jgi:hypothetical protein
MVKPVLPHRETIIQFLLPGDELVFTRLNRLGRDTPSGAVPARWPSGAAAVANVSEKARFQLGRSRSRISAPAAV